MQILIVLVALEYFEIILNKVFYLQYTFTIITLLINMFILSTIIIENLLGAWLYAGFWGSSRSYPEETATLVKKTGK